jgi:hypothetical protein
MGVPGQAAWSPAEPHFLADTMLKELPTPGQTWNVPRMSRLCLTLEPSERQSTLGPQQPGCACPLYFWLMGFGTELSLSSPEMPFPCF